MRQELWMKHDVRSRFDPKMSAFIAKHGMQGYGAFWALLEILHYQNDHEIDMVDEFEGVAHQINLPTNTLQEIITTAVELGLFQLSGETRLFQARLKQEQADRSLLQGASSASKCLAGRIGGKISAAKRRGATPKEIQQLRSTLQAEVEAGQAFALEEKRREEKRSIYSLYTKPESEPEQTKQKRKPRLQPYLEFDEADFNFPPRFGPRAKTAVGEWVKYKSGAGHPKLLVSYQTEVDHYRDEPERYTAFVYRAIKEQWQGFNERVPLDLDQSPKTQQRSPSAFERNLAKREQLTKKLENEQTEG